MDTQQEGSRGEGKGPGPEAALEAETMGPALLDYRCGGRVGIEPGYYAQVCRCRAKVRTIFWDHVVSGPYRATEYNP